jgi:1-acyl-sn-glycerol-3-phosphate acyltransferase
MSELPHTGDTIWRNGDDAAHEVKPIIVPDMSQVGLAVEPTDGLHATATEGETRLAELSAQAEEAAQAGQPGAELARGALRLIRENLERTPPGPFKQVAERIRDNLSDDILTPEFWQGIALVLRYQLDERVEAFKRRQRGEYATDAYGYDPQVLEAALPFARFLYHSWWRVSAHGIEHIPPAGRALMVSNHSGVLPFDGAMIVTAVLEQHPQRRLVRNLFNDWFAAVPYLAPLLTSMGQVQAQPENALRLLAEDELVCVFPEGYKGIGKPFKQRYKLGRFGRGGYVQAALRTGAPLIPTAVVGAEEIYPLIGNMPRLAKAIGAPYFPITPFFPRSARSRCPPSGRSASAHPSPPKPMAPPPPTIRCW